MRIKHKVYLTPWAGRVASGSGFECSISVPCLLARGWASLFALARRGGSLAKTGAWELFAWRFSAIYNEFKSLQSVGSGVLVEACQDPGVLSGLYPPSKSTNPCAYLFGAQPQKPVSTVPNMPSRNYPMSGASHQAPQIASPPSRS